MPSEKATAIVIRSVEFSETSLVVTLFHAGIWQDRGFGEGGETAQKSFRVCS